MAEYISPWIKKEIEKKATAGVPLAQPTPDKQNYYNQYQSGLGAQEGWGVGYTDDKVSGGFNQWTDPTALGTEISRMETVIGNREKSGLSNVTQSNYLNQLNTRYEPYKPVDPDQYKTENATIDDIAKKYGFDFSREYAKRQAEAEAQAKRNANEDAQRRNQSNKELNTKAIDNNLMGMAEGLDRNYFQKYMQQAQNQVNNGLNAGIAADQDLRLAMSRQAEMGDAYRDANLGKMQENQRFTNEDLRLAEALGLINQEALAREDALFNERLMQGAGLAQNLDQFNLSQNGMLMDAAINQRGQNLAENQANRNFRWKQWMDEAALTGTYKGKPTMAKQQYQADKAWREYTFNNMSAAEKAAFEQNSAQFGEEMAWRLFELEYSGNLQQSMLDSELGYYSDFNGGAEGGGFDYSQYKVTSPFGMRKDPFTGKSVMHNGVDIAMAKGDPVGATIGGTVVYAGMGQPGSGYGGYGNVVVIKDANGNLHQYSHLDSVKVKKGQKVNGGMVLGGAGSTGRSTGVHLEYMVKNSKGTAINPTGFLNGSHASQKGQGGEPSSYKNMWKTQKEASKSSGFKTFTSHLNSAIKSGKVPANWGPGLTELIGRESTWNPKAQNPSSSAYGYGQLIAANVGPYEKKTGYKYSDPVGQVIITARYVKDRYGTPEKALKHWDEKGWY